jgi:SnoaL-like domain
MKSVEERLTELCDREAIRDLPVRYCDCVWRGDVAGIVDLFADDGSFTIKGRKREVTSQGREALFRMYGEGPGTMNPRPYIHNHVVELGFYGRATGRCYVELRNADRDMEWAGTGYYADEYVKVGERWKFASRYFTTIQLGLARPRAAAKSAAAKPAVMRRAVAKPAKAKSPAKAASRKAPAKAAARKVPAKAGARKKTVTGGRKSRR